MVRRWVLAGVLLSAISFVASGCAKPTPFNKGQKLFKQGSYRTAEKEFDTAVKEGSDVYGSYVYLARIAGIEGDYPKGIELCKKALERTPKGASAIYYISVLYQLNQQYRLSEQMLDKLAERPGMAGFSIAVVQPPVGAAAREPLPWREFPSRDRRTPA